MHDYVHTQKMISLKEHLDKCKHVFSLCEGTSYLLRVL